MDGDERVRPRIDRDRLALWPTGFAFGFCAPRRGVVALAPAAAMREPGLMRDWLEALAAEKRARRSFADIERRLASPEVVRAYRAWRKALEDLR